MNEPDAGKATLAAHLDWAPRVFSPDDPNLKFSLTKENNNNT
jgi:hypothetical protein